jgi:hypothetical protein
VVLRISSVSCRDVSATLFHGVQIKFGPCVKAPRTYHWGVGTFDRWGGEPNRDHECERSGGDAWRAVAHTRPHWPKFEAGKEDWRRSHCDKAKPHH